MTRLCSLKRSIMCAACVFVWVGRTAAVSGLGAPDIAVDDIKQLVVMVEVKLAGEPRIGAGIIFGFGTDDLYIATANHVVRDGRTDAEEIWIRFSWLSDQRVRAALMPQADTKLDLAVLRVGGLRAIAARVDALPFERVRNPNTVKLGDGVHLLGYPLSKPWRMNATPERFAGQSGDLLEFESNFIAAGHSGGALLDENLDLIGMLEADTPPYGKALSIDALIK